MLLSSVDRISCEGIRTMSLEPGRAAPRTSIGRKFLESAIATGVKPSDPSCEAFVGVVLQRSSPKSPGGANWTIKGIKFGRAERDKCSAAINSIVEQMQREYEISD